MKAYRFNVLTPQIIIRQIVVYAYDLKQARKRGIKFVKNSFTLAPIKHPKLKLIKDENI